MRRFYFRLATRLGMSVKRMLAEMDAYELGEWYIMENIDYYEPRVQEAQRTAQEKAILLKTALFPAHYKGEGDGE